MIFHFEYLLICRKLPAWQLADDVEADFRPADRIGLGSEKCEQSEIGG